jgi:hypothetical protein
MSLDSAMSKSLLELYADDLRPFLILLFVELETQTETAVLKVRCDASNPRSCEAKTQLGCTVIRFVRETATSTSGSTAA